VETTKKSGDGAMLPLTTVYRIIWEKLSLRKFGLVSLFFVWAHRVKKLNNTQKEKLSKRGLGARKTTGTIHHS